MVYRRLAVALAAVLVTSASAHAWDPIVVGHHDPIATASPAAAVTDDSPARIAHGARVTPEMVSEAAIPDDTGYATTEPSPARVAYAAAKVSPEMVSEAAIADDASVADASPAAVAGTPAQESGLGSGAAPAGDGGQGADLVPTRASTRSSK